MTTIKEAVISALRDWTESEHTFEEAQDLAEEFAFDAVDEWKSDFAEGRTTSVSEGDSETIAGSVINAMNDWHSSGHSVEQMEALVNDLVQSACDEFDDSNDPDIDAVSPH